MKCMMSSVAATLVLLAAGLSEANHGFGGCGGTAGCGYASSLWDGFCDSGTAGCCDGHGGFMGQGCGCGHGGFMGQGCGFGQLCGGRGCCPPSSSYVGWWYGGAPGCGLACVRGHNNCTTNSYGWGLNGGFSQGCCGGGGFDGVITGPMGRVSGCNSGRCGHSSCGSVSGCGCGSGGCGSRGGFGGGLRNLAERIRGRIACRSWIGGGVLDAYGVCDNFGNSGVNYGYLNQWDQTPAQGCCHGTGPNAVVQSHPNFSDNQTNAHAGNDGSTNRLLDSETIGDVPHAPEFSD